MTAPHAVSAPRFGFVKLIVADLEAAEAFYASVLGMQRVNEIAGTGFREFVLVSEGNPVSLILYQHTDGRRSTLGNAHGPLGWMTRDLDALLTHALAHGAVLMTPPTDAHGLRFAFINSPDGHEIELVQVVRKT